VSDIVKTAFGYHIVKVDEKRKRQLEPFEQTKGKLESQLQGEKRMEIAKAYLERIRKDYQVKMNEVNIKALADEINTASAPNGISVAEFTKRFAPDQKARPLATTTVGNYTIADFLTNLESSGFSQLPPNVNGEQIKSMVESEMIVKPLIADAKKTGVEKQKSVQKDIERLKEEKMVELLYQKEIRDKLTISDAEIDSYYKTHSQNYGQPATVTVLKLVGYDKKVADSLATLASKGSDFGKLVEENSIDRLSAANGGRVQLRAGADPVIDSLAQKTRIGGVAGPVATGEGFLIIKLLDRKEEVSTPLEVARPYAKNDLQKEKEESSFKTLLKQARDKYKPSINEKLLAKLKFETAATTAPKSKAPK
jgi:parvulin-like peptidyl-prolyl isomerase